MRDIDCLVMIANVCHRKNLTDQNKYHVIEIIMRDWEKEFNHSLTKIYIDTVEEKQCVTSP